MVNEHACDFASNLVNRPLTVVVLLYQHDSKAWVEHICQLLLQGSVLHVSTVGFEHCLCTAGIMLGPIDIVGLAVCGCVS